MAGWTLEGDFGEADAAEALRILEQSNTPAGRQEVMRELVRLKALTMCRPQSQDDLTLQLAALADEMAAYPADVARDACRVWAAGSRFFPTWAELRALCEDGVRQRRDLLAALRRYFAQRAAEDQAADQTELPAYNNLWKSKQAALKAKIGARAHGAWLVDLMPVTPPDGTEAYYLGAATVAIRDYVAGHYAEDLAAVLGRPVEIVVFNPRRAADRAKWSRR